MSYRSSSTVLTKKIGSQGSQSDQYLTERKFYTHEFTKREDRIHAGHFQLLRNLKTVSPYDVYFAVEQGIAHYNSKSRDTPQVIVKETSPNFVLTVFECWKDIIAFGSPNGKIYLYSMEKASFIYRNYELARGEGMIINHL